MKFHLMSFIEYIPNSKNKYKHTYIYERKQNENLSPMHFLALETLSKQIIFIFSLQMYFPYDWIFFHIHNHVLIIILFLDMNFIYLKGAEKVWAQIAPTKFWVMIKYQILGKRTFCLVWELFNIHLCKLWIVCTYSKYRSHEHLKINYYYFLKDNKFFSIFIYLLLFGGLTF